MRTGPRPNLLRQLSQLTVETVGRALTNLQPRAVFASQRYQAVAWL